LDVEHEEMVALTTFVVKQGSRLFSVKFAKSMACRRIVKLRRCLLTLSAGRTDASTGPACVGLIDMRAQAEVRCAQRTDTPKPLSDARFRAAAIASASCSFFSSVGGPLLALARERTRRLVRRRRRLREPRPQVIELPPSFGRGFAAEVQEYLERGLSGPVEELHAQRTGVLIHVAALLDGERRTQLRPADVHVQGLRLRNEKLEQLDTLRGGLVRTLAGLMLASPVDGLTLLSQPIAPVADDRCLRSTLPKRISGVYYNVA
jgi:hypothetical protein